MTIQLDKTADCHNSPGQPFGAGLAFQNLLPITALAQKMGKAEEIKAPARSVPLAVQVYKFRLFCM